MASKLDAVIVRPFIRPSVWLVVRECALPDNGSMIDYLACTVFRSGLTLASQITRTAGMR